MGLSLNNNNKLRPTDRAAHDWYRFVLSFPPHLVSQYLQRFGVGPHQCVLDPFCGTGTTLVECKKHGIPSVGVEVIPMSCFASRVKVDWVCDAEKLVEHAREVSLLAGETLATDGIDDVQGPLFGTNRTPFRTLSEEAAGLILTDSISPLPLHKTLVLLESMERLWHRRFTRYERLALARAVVADIGNLHFGPEVGVGRIKADASVIGSWLRAVRVMSDDLRALRRRTTTATVYQADSRQILNFLAPQSIDAVITSPPYPNEKDYTRTTRLESVLLGFMRTKGDLRRAKQGLIRSNTRGVFKADTDDWEVSEHDEIQRIAEAIEARRIALGKTSGFERLYARVTKLYFGGMSRHLCDLREILRPGARLAYVVGDQASYLRVMIRTGTLLAGIAESLGYEIDGIDLFRTRLSTATKEQLREEVVVFRWPGRKVTSRSLPMNRKNRMSDAPD